MGRTALVLGGGIGGITVANELRKRLSPQDRVIVIERNGEYVFPPSLLWLSVGLRSLQQIQRPLRQLLRTDIELVQGNVEAIDPANRTVTVGTELMRADAIVIALGAELSAESIPGLAQAGYNFYSPPGSERLSKALGSFTGGKVVILTASPSYKCPAAPYEEAMLIEDALRRRGLRECSTVEVHAAEAAPMLTAGPKVAAALVEMLRTKGIAYFPNHQVTSADPVAQLLSFADGSTAPYDLLAFVPVHYPPPLLADSGLGGDGGWISVDRSLLHTQFADIYAIGDVTSIPLKMGKPLPKAGIFAGAQAKILARNIANAWAGRAASEHFDGRGACFVETGGSRAALGAGNFFAEPTPAVALRPPSQLWHIEKVLLEKKWLRRWL